MKNLKVLFSIFLFTLLATSCENDDPLASVKYQIVGLDDSVSQIKYDVIGGSVTLIDPDDFNNGNDSRTLNINLLPFEAKLQVTAGNASLTDKTYVLKIFVNGNEKASTNLVVEAESSAVGTVEYEVGVNN